jgi:hypothetical protein
MPFTQVFNGWLTINQKWGYDLRPISRRPQQSGNLTSCCFCGRASPTSKEDEFSAGSDVSASPTGSTFVSAVLDLRSYLMHALESGRNPAVRSNS